MLIVITGLSLLLYKMKLDYYEDVLAATEYAEAAIKAKREGRNMTFNLRTGSIRNGFSAGAKALFAKTCWKSERAPCFYYLTESPYRLFCLLLCSS